MYFILCMYCAYGVTITPINRLKASSSNGSSLVASSCENGCKITLDSGMPYIAGPSDEITTLQGFIGAKQDSSGDVWDKYYCELLVCQAKNRVCNQGAASGFINCDM